MTKFQKILINIFVGLTICYAVAATIVVTYHILTN